MEIKPSLPLNTVKPATAPIAPISEAQKAIGPGGCVQTGPIFEPPGPNRPTTQVPPILPTPGQQRPFPQDPPVFEMPVPENPFPPLPPLIRSQTMKDLIKFAQEDSNDDGTISETEFGIVPGPNDGINWRGNQERERQFGEYDTDNDGQLTPAEYLAGLKEDRTIGGGELLPRPPRYPAST